jgi:LacI family transcriptional regulator
MKKNITIQDIADELGLSRNTVSKALNGGYLPEKTKALVINKAKEMNYKHLNTTESGPNGKNYKLLLLSGKPLNNINFFLPIMRGIDNYCYENKYELLKYTFNDNISSYETLSNYIINLNIDGIIAIETFDKDFILKLLDFNIPVTFIDFCSHTTQINGYYDIIETSNREPIYHISKILNKKYGVTKFSFVGDYTHCMSFKNRYLGMLQALILSNIQHTKNDDILKTDNFDYGNPEILSNEILKLPVMPECFICANDFIARSVINALNVLKLNVPNDVLVVGYDDAVDSTSARPTITTVGMDKDFLGSEAVRVLVNRINNPTMPMREITLNSKIIPRESTRNK